ncbi:MAG: 6-bladed beta-propeller [Candidatus Izemoplasmatales bacterium]
MLFIFLFLVSCNSDNNIKDNLKLNVFKINPKLSDEIFLSEIFSKIDYIPLESDSISLIGSINSMKIYGDFIFINDGDQIFQFYKDGSYIDKFGNKGKGPGEYINLKDFQVDTINNVLEILDLNGQKIIYYSLTGEFIGQWDLGLYAYDYYKLNDANYIFYSGYEKNSNTNFSLNVLEKHQKEITQKYFPINKNMAWYYYLMQERHFYAKGDSLFCFRSPFDTIYYIQENEIIPSRVLDFGEHKMPLSFIHNKFEDIFEYGIKADENSYVHHVNHLIENDLYLFFTFRYKEEKMQYFFNKKVSREWLGGTLINDLKLNGLKTQADYNYIPRAYDEDAFYYVVEPYLLLDQLKDVREKCNNNQWEQYLNNNPDIKEITQTVNLDSNPIISINYIKQ